MSSPPRSGATAAAANANNAAINAILYTVAFVMVYIAFRFD